MNYGSLKKRKTMNWLFLSALLAKVRILSNGCKFLTCVYLVYLLKKFHLATLHICHSLIGPFILIQVSSQFKLEHAFILSILNPCLIFALMYYYLSYPENLNCVQSHNHLAMLTSLARRVGVKDTWRSFQDCVSSMWLHRSLNSALFLPSTVSTTRALFITPNVQSMSLCSSYFIAT